MGQAGLRDRPAHLVASAGGGDKTLATVLRHLHAHHARLLVLGALLGALVPLDASLFHVNALSAALRLLTAPPVP